MHTTVGARPGWGWIRWFDAIMVLVAILAVLAAIVHALFPMFVLIDMSTVALLLIPVLIRYFPLLAEVDWRGPRRQQAWDEALERVRASIEKAREEVERETAEDSEQRRVAAGRIAVYARDLWRLFSTSPTGALARLWAYLDVVLRELEASGAVSSTRGTHSEVPRSAVYAALQQLSALCEQAVHQDGIDAASAARIIDLGLQALEMVGVPREVA
jgi:hypothetical protein